MQITALMEVSAKAEWISAQRWRADDLMVVVVEGSKTIFTLKPSCFSRNVWARCIRDGKTLLRRLDGEMKAIVSPFWRARGIVAMMFF